MTVSVDGERVDRRYAARVRTILGGVPRKRSTLCPVPSRNTTRARVGLVVEGCGALKMGGSLGPVHAKVRDDVLPDMVWRIRPRRDVAEDQMIPRQRITRKRQGPLCGSPVQPCWSQLRPADFDRVRSVWGAETRERGAVKKTIGQLRKFVTVETVQVILLALPLGYVLISELKVDGFRIDSFFETSILLSFLLVAIATAIARMVSNQIGRYVEDNEKLTDDYAALGRRYSREDLLQYVTPAAVAGRPAERQTCPIVPLIVRSPGDEPL